MGCGEHCLLLLAVFSCGLALSVEDVEPREELLALNSFSYDWKSLPHRFQRLSVLQSASREVETYVEGGLFYKTDHAAVDLSYTRFTTRNSDAALFIGTTGTLGSEGHYDFHARVSDPPAVFTHSVCVPLSIVAHASNTFEIVLRGFDIGLSKHFPTSATVERFELNLSDAVVDGECLSFEVNATLDLAPEPTRPSEGLKSYHVELEVQYGIIAAPNVVSTSGRSNYELSYKGGFQPPHPLPSPSQDTLVLQGAPLTAALKEGVLAVVLLKGVSFDLRVQVQAKWPGIDLRAITMGLFNQTFDPELGVAQVQAVGLVSNSGPAARALLVDVSVSATLWQSFSGDSFGVGICAAKESGISYSKQPVILPLTCED